VVPDQVVIRTEPLCAQITITEAVTFDLLEQTAGTGRHLEWMAVGLAKQGCFSVTFMLPSYLALAILTPLSLTHERNLVTATPTGKGSAVALGPKESTRRSET
jgi:hypothetical protein